MMEGKAGVIMESRKRMSRAKSNSPMKRTIRRAVAWLLVFCMCMANMNSAVYAAEIATASDALMAATPSDATATDSNAAEILMPEQTVSGEELKEEAVRAISAGHEFDFDSEIRVVKDAEGKNESYSELFKGCRGFTLFADNGNGGRLTGGNENAYGYIVVRVDENAYKAFEEAEGEASASSSDAEEERVWSLTGDEELIFLYVNADDGTVTFSLNIENLEADDIVVPSRAELYEDTEEAEETSPAEKPAEDGSEAGGSGSGGGSGSSSGSSDDAQDDPTDEGASDDSQADGGQTEDGSGNGTDTEDTERPDEKPEDGQNQEGGSDGQQENNDSSNTDKEDGNTDSGNDGNTGDNSSDSDSGNTDSGSGSDSGKDEGGSSDQGSSSDKGDSNQDGSDSNSGSDSGNAGNSGNSDSGSSDKGNSDSGNSGSSDSGNSSDKGGSDSDSAKLSKSSLNLPMVMGPNPNAEFEEDEFGDMSFDEWQEMMEEEAEEDEEDYTEEVSVAYDSEDEAISYLNMTMLPAVGAVVKKTEQTKGIAKLFRSSRSNEAEAVVMAGVVPLSGIVPAEGTYYKQIEQNADGSYRLHLGVTGGEQQGLDIVLAIDLSNSMDDKIGHGNTTRLEALKDTLGYRKEVEKNGFIDDLFAQSPNSRFSVVTYSDKSATKLEWTGLGSNSSGKAKIKETIGNLDANGGTNYEAGLYEAIEILKKRGNSSNIPVVIFLSDGKPTYYYAPVNEFNEAHDKSGAGSRINENTGDGTIFAAGKFHDEMEKMNGSIYTVGFGIPELYSEWGSDKNDYAKYQPEQYLYAISQGLTWETGWDEKLVAPKNNDGTTLETDGADAQGLKDAFADILSNLKMENVTISDQLSKFVTFKGDTAGASNVKVQTFRKNEFGELVLVKELQEGSDYESLEFNPEAGTIKLVFGKDRTLESGMIYELSFDIQMKDGVEIQPGNKATGDPNTDYGKGQISSGKPGVRTNTEGYFTFGEDGTTKVYYPHPIIPASATYTPEHQKYIKDNGDGTYDLTLTVKSDKGSEIVGGKDPIPADIMFVIDKSGSMDDKIAGTTKRKIINDCLNDLIITVSNGDTDVQYAGYKFSDKDEALRVDFKEEWYEESTYWTGETQKAISKLQLTDDQTSGSTYPSYALGQAIEKLETGSHSGTDRKKYLIFFTDGAPGRNNSDISTKEMTRCYSAIEKLDSDAAFYAIRVGYEDPEYKFMENMVSSAGTEDAHLYSGMDKESIKAAFQQIADDIAGQIGTQTTGVTNAVISDKLSVYADMVEGSEIIVTRDGEVLTEGSDYTKTYNADTKTVEVRFNGELVQYAVYEVTFKVKPSQTAKDAYQQDGGYYHNPDGSSTENEFTGDEGTDAPGNTTSSGMPGFPSNEKAVLSWQYDGASGKTDYDHPVLQVPQTGQFVVQKLVTIEDNETPLADAKFIINLEKTNAEGSQDVPFSSVALKDKEISPVVKTEGEAQFKISEAVPMEYSLTGIEVFQKAAGEKPETDVTDDRWNDTNKVLTVKPGDDLIVKVTNNLAHEGYFHSVDQVTNWTNGKPGTPFTSDKTPAREAAESQPKADTGKKNKKVAEMEEEEGDPLV